MSYIPSAHLFIIFLMLMSTDYLSCMPLSNLALFLQLWCYTACREKILPIIFAMNGLKKIKCSVSVIRNRILKILRGIWNFQGTNGNSLSQFTMVSDSQLRKVVSNCFPHLGSKISDPRFLPWVLQKSSTLQIVVKPII